MGSMIQVALSVRTQLSPTDSSPMKLQPNKHSFTNTLWDDFKTFMNLSEMDVVSSCFTETFFVIRNQQGWTLLTNSQLNWCLQHGNVATKLNMKISFVV